MVTFERGAPTIRKVRSDQAIVGTLATGALTFGTTVATNALLERTGVPTLLVVTEGFADLVRLGDMSRPDLFDPDARWPDPLCTRVVEVPGRLDPHGHEIEPLQVPEIDLEGIEAVAVVLLNSHRNPAHELAVAQTLSGVHLALGHQVSPELGYLARIETTLVDAAVTPILRAALHKDRIPADARALRSDGSLCPPDQFRAPDAVLSGPARGVMAVAAVAAMAGFERAVGLDMGGTSTDLCRVEVGSLPRREGDVRVAGVRLRRPMLEVDTIAAGGGSILWNDGQRLGVGPRSAGAHPGPQCYGAGGPPTLTDAALALGLVDPLAFDPPLDPTLVHLPGEAQDFVDLAREHMAAAVRRLAVSRGIDLSDHALVAYGGAAGQHACGVAERLGIRTVLLHPFASVLSAWGQSLAVEQETAVRALWLPFPSWPAVRAAWHSLLQELPALGEVERTVELRHVGTDHAIAVTGQSPEQARAAFEREHRQRYGFDRDLPIEVVNARVRVGRPAPSLPPPPPDPFALKGDVRGPTVLHAPTTSVQVPAGWTASLRDGLLHLHHSQAPARSEPAERTPAGVALWAGRFMAVAEQAGALLQRTARSVNIRERLDFSCALFDEDGHLVANAPHIPVHLGAMGETVRALLAEHPDPEPGQAWLTNDPSAGGSHLPDLTVTTAVRHEGRRFFVACRAHHVDVGGLTPGSMPPQSRTLAEEGEIFRNVPLLHEGRVKAPRIGRQPDTVQADLEAQVASNAHAARALKALGPAALTATWMAHLRQVALEAVGEVLGGLSGTACDTLDGVPLQVTLRPSQGRLTVDFTGTGGPHPGNLNAPKAVVRAAVLYTLRVLVARPIPLNEGALDPIDLIIPAGSLLDPPPGCAVVGGNVETSQRLVDLLLRAAGARAASQGTMNNLTLGGPGWSLYETIGGGGGASAAGPGAHGRQVHMTNTRATDAEVLEQRLPLRLRRFALAPGTGGEGQHPGGDGVLRELEVTAPAVVSLLATRRHLGAPGLHGGGAGTPGQDALHRGAWRPWDGSEQALDPGDRVRVQTPGGGGFGSPEPKSG